METNQQIVDTAWLYHDNGDYDTAFALCLPVAEGGFAPAQNLMGVLYSNGRGVEKNIDTAIEWYSKAAAKNYRAAMFNLGRLYDLGQDVPQDREKAFEWHVRAASAGSVNSMCRVAEMFGKGEGVPENQQEAVVWLIKAAKAGSKLADTQLGLMFLDESAREYAYLMYPYMEQKAIAGDKEAQGVVAAALRHGLPGVKKDLDKAVYWYEKLAADGDEISRDIINEIKRSGE